MYCTVVHCIAMHAEMNGFALYSRTNRSLCLYQLKDISVVPTYRSIAPTVNLVYDIWITAALQQRKLNVLCVRAWSVARDLPQVDR